MKTKTLAYISLFLITTITFNVQGQEKLTQIENFRYGKLGNGLSYFIKDLETPQKQTLMKFYIKAGSGQEDTDQLQMAHLLEHLAFKPTNKFLNGIQREALKVKVTNRDVGGATGFKATSYSFDAPPQNQKAIKLGLKWFKEIAVGLKLTDKNINQERGSVKQEFIYGSRDDLEKYYAEKNLEAKLFPCHSSFDSFLNHIQTFPNENLRRFYKDWYRPDLMGVAIVGNIHDMQSMEQLVRSIFGEIAKDDDPRIKTNCDSLYFERPPQFVIEELKGGTMREKVQTGEYQLVFRQPKLAENIGTEQGYKQYIAFQLFLGIMRERLLQKQNEKGRSFRIFVKNTYKYGPAPFAYMISFKADEQSVKKNFKGIFRTLQQIRKYGILDQEWKRAKEKYKANRIKEDARYWQQQLKDYFVKGTALFKDKQEILYQWMQALSVDDFNELINQFLSPMPEDIGIITPTGSKALQYTETQVRTWILQSNQQPVSPYRLPKITREVLTSEEVNELKEMEYKDLGWKKNGTKVIVLKNGVKVVLKPYVPTKGIGEDRIKLHGFSRTGAACFSKNNYYSALNAPSIIEFSGVGRFSAAQIKSFMKTSNIASCKPYIDYKESGIQGLVNLTNMEELLQLIYLYYTQPKYDGQLVENWKKMERKIYHTRVKDIREDFKNKMRHFYGDSILPPTLGSRYLKSTEAFKSIEKTNGKRGFEIYQQIFSQPQDFSFIITGNFELDRVLPLIQKYLGNLPQGMGAWTCENTEKMFTSIKDGPIYKEMITEAYQMESVKYVLSYIKAVKKKSTWKEIIKLRVLGELADIMLNRLRYEKGFAVYNFGAAGRYNPDHFRYKINFDVTCQVEELKPIKQECQKIIWEIKKGKIKKMHFRQAIKKIQGRYAKQNLLEHRNMRKLLYEQLRYNKPWVALERYDEFLRSLDIKDIVKIANKYFQKKHQYEFVLSDQTL